MMRCWLLKYEEARKIIMELLGEQIIFEGHFDMVFDNLKDNLKKSFLDWIVDCKEGRGRFPEKSPKYPNILVFFFKPNVTNVRGILTKEKNKFFLVLFLDKHKYYDREREKLGF